MSLVHVLSVGFALAICAGPVLLLRRGAVEPVPTAILRNARIAYYFRVSLFLPLFALGAAADVWPAIAGAIGLAIGLSLLERLRRRGGAEARDTASVRLVTALAMVVGLLGLVGAEAAALAVVAGPFLGEGTGTGLFVVLLVAATLLGRAAGIPRMDYVAQALLGAAFLGLLGSSAFLIYLLASDLRPLPPHGAFALVALAASCIALLTYRQSKYVETPMLAPPGTTGWRRTLATQVRLLQRLANVAVSVFAALAIVLAGMAFHTLGFWSIAQGAVAALGTPPTVTAMGCVAIALLATAYPLVEAVGWRSTGDLTGSPRRESSMVAGEVAMLAVFACAFGALATLSTDLPPDSTGIAEFVRQLVAFDHPITEAALSLLLVGLFAMAAAMMGIAVSLAMTICRLDILPAMRPGGAEDDPSSDGAASALTCTILAGTGVPWIASGVAAAGSIDARFFALALLFAGLHLALLPIALARSIGIALPPWAALGGVLGGAAAGLGCLAAHAASGDPLGLWLVTPASISPGLALLTAAALVSRRGAPTR